MNAFLLTRIEINVEYLHQSFDNLDPFVPARSGPTPSVSNSSKQNPPQI
jgi:hypothetical protein